jgi:hypothetical protein
MPVLPAQRTTDMLLERIRCREFLHIDQRAQGDIQRISAHNAITGKLAPLIVVSIDHLCIRARKCCENRISKSMVLWRQKFFLLL